MTESREPSADGNTGVATEDVSLKKKGARAVLPGVTPCRR